MFADVDRELKAWHVLGALAVALALGSFLGFVASPRLQDYSSGLDIFDMRMAGYGHDDAVAMLAALGPDGRAYYRGTQLADIFFPPAWFLAISLMFLFLSRPGERFAAPLPESVRISVVTVAFMAMLLDWSENIVVFIMLMGDGRPSPISMMNTTMFSLQSRSIAMKATVTTEMRTDSGSGAAKRSPGRDRKRNISEMARNQAGGKKMSASWVPR